MNRIFGICNCFLSVFLQTWGFSNVQDFMLSVYPHKIMNVLLASLVVTLINRMFGIPAELFFGLIGFVMLDLVTGTIVSIHYRGERFSGTKFARFFFKLFVLLWIICGINQLKVGFNKMVTDVAYVEFIVNFSLDSLFIFFMFAMSWYTVTSVMENMAATGNQFFGTMAKYLKLKVKKVEQFATDEK